MNKIVLLIFEGEKAEPRIFNSLRNSLFSSVQNTVLYAYFKGDIYQLWSKLSKDPFLDIIEVIREKDPNYLPGVKRKDISQVYLFFDHDGHARQDIRVSMSAIPEMLSFFDNETENGKLFISYPMIEAIKDVYPNGSLCCTRCCVPISQNTEYKKLVSSRSIYTNVTIYNKRIWKLLIIENLKKANCIISDTYSMPDISLLDSFDQLTLYHFQELKYIIPFHCVAVLSAIPLFIIEYFDKSIIETEFYVTSPTAPEARSSPN